MQKLGKKLQRLVILKLKKYILKDIDIENVIVSNKISAGEKKL